MSYNLPLLKNMNEEKPFAIAKEKDVLSLYNEENKTKEKKLSDEIAEWFVSRAKELGWSNAGFLGKDCLLKV